MSTKIVTNQFRVNVAIGIRESLAKTTPDYYYLFMGKLDAWDDDNNPPDLADNQDAIDQIRQDMFFIKRIAYADTCHVVPRVDWETNTIYDQYDSADSDLFIKTFYVLTDDYHVYKCIDNNSGGFSTVKPTGTSTSIITTGDNYQWKFMYDITPGFASKFLTNDWMPVTYGTSATTLQQEVQDAASWSLGDPPGGHGYSAVHELGAYYVMFNQSFDRDEGGDLSTSIEFRQVGIYINPLSIIGSTTLSGTSYTVNQSNSIVDVNSTGRILYVENRKPITRDTQQSEIETIILEF